jgi:hypothetical protein
MSMTLAPGVKLTHPLFGGEFVGAGWRNHCGCGYSISHEILHEMVHVKSLGLRLLEQTSLNFGWQFNRDSHELHSSLSQQKEGNVSCPTLPASCVGGEAIPRAKVVRPEKAALKGCPNRILSNSPGNLNLTETARSARERTRDGRAFRRAFAHPRPPARASQKSRYPLFRRLYRRRQCVPR